VSRPAASIVPQLDLHRYELRVEGKAVRLEKIPMELLIFLVNNRDKLVSREAIVERLWGKNVYLETEQGINTAVRKIRQALRDDPEQPQFLQTVVGKGYRFVGPITLIGNGSSETAATSLEPAEKAVHPTRRFWTIAAMLAGLGLALTVLVASGRVGFSVRDPGAEPGIRSIAVLPLENVSGDPDQEYLADGVTDALTTDLAQIHSLRVISRTSALHYRGSVKSMPEIAKDLSVDAVVEGTFARSGKRVRITAQLIQAATDRHLWAETYEQSFQDVLSLQSAIALDIAREISATLGSREQLRLAHTPRITAEAQEAYLRGRYLLSLRGSENLLRAPYYFQLAVDKDPTFAEAYAGLAESYSTCAGWGLVRSSDVDAKVGAAAMKAVELDDDSSAAHTALASYMCSRKDREGVEREVRRALELNPNNSMAHKLYGLYLHLNGQLDAGLAEEMRAQDLDPLAAHQSLSLGHLLYDAKQFDRAIAQYQRAIVLDPKLQFLHLNIGWAYAHQGLHEAAVKEWSRHWEHIPAASKILNRAYERSGYRGYLRAQLGKEFAEAFKPLAFSDYQRTVIYTELGDNDHAFDSLDKAVKQHDEDLEEVWVDPDLEKLRSDPRFHDFVLRCGVECGAEPALLNRSN
jgi:TolB-like protein/DNA-binding winged helix-turn-helix (wHTH) protein/Flp pilus assembly protein TadD